MLLILFFLSFSLKMKAQFVCDPPQETNSLIDGFSQENTSICGQSIICFKVSQCHFTINWKVDIFLPNGIVVTDPSDFTYNSSTNTLSYYSTDDVTSPLTLCFKIQSPLNDAVLKFYAEHNSAAGKLFDYDCYGLTSSANISGNVYSSDPIIAQSLYKSIINLDGTLNFTSSLNLTNKTFIMGPGAQIISKSGVNVGFDKCTFLACDKMWKGISVEGGSSVKMSGCTVKDAENAISLSTNSKFFSDVLNMSTFSNNFTCINVDGVPDNTSRYNSNYTGGSLKPKYSGQVNWKTEAQNGIQISNCSTERTFNGNFSNLQFGIRVVNNSIAKIEQSFFDNCYYGIFNGSSELHALNNQILNSFYGIWVQNSGGKTIEISGNEKIEAAIGIALMVSNKLNAIVLGNKIWAKSVNNAAAVNGIQIVSCNNATKLELNTNTINYALNNNFPNNSYYGIRVNGCNRIKVLNNTVVTGQYLNLNTNGIRLSQTTNAIVKENTVYGTGVLKEKTSGIYVTSSSNWQICYNHLSKTQKGVEFYSASPSPKRFSHNDMTNHTVGLELDPSTTIGVQYSFTNPFAGGNVFKYTMGNQWVSGLTVGARFLTDNVDQVRDSYFGVNQNYQPDKPDVIDCKYPWFEGGYTELYPCNDLYEWEVVGKLERDIARNQLALQDYTATGRWIAQQQLYEARVYGGSLDPTQVSSVLDSFTIANTNTDLGKLAQVKQLIFQYQENNINDPNALQVIHQLNNSVGGSDIFIQNEKSYNTILINTVLNGINELNSTQIHDLYAIANQCDLSGGTAVHSARGLYNMLVDNSIDFDLVQCAPVGSRSNEANQKITSSFNVFPNPASELIQLNGLDQYPATVSVQVTDIYGKVLLNNSITNGNTIDIQRIPSGVYFCSVLENGHQLAIAKFVKTN